jgi:hypothetical protein
MRRSAAVLLAVVVLVGCAPADRPALLPDGVTASVHQSRADLGLRRLQVAIRNPSGVDLTITGLRVESRQFAGAAVWQKDSTIVAAGRTVNLPVLLPRPRCDDEGAATSVPAPPPTVELAFSLPGVDGDGGTARLRASDPGGRMPRLAAEDCLGVEVARLVDITADTPPRLDTVDGRLVARLDLAVVPEDAPGWVTIDEVRGTVLLAVADPATGARATAQATALRVGEGSAPSTIALTLVPGRCDPHVVAEDKRGTVFPLRVTTDGGTTGIVFVAASDEVRLALYDFVRTACGW